MHAVPITYCKDKLLKQDSPSLQISEAQWTTALVLFYRTKSQYRIFLNYW